MKKNNLNGYVSPDMELIIIINENIICASTGLWGSSNESLNWEEKDTGDITFGW